MSHINLFILDAEFRNNYYNKYYKFILSGAQKLLENVLEGSSFWDLIALLYKKQLIEARTGDGNKR